MTFVNMEVCSVFTCDMSEVLKIETFKTCLKYENMEAFSLWTLA